MATPTPKMITSTVNCSLVVVVFLPPLSYHIPHDIPPQPAGRAVNIFHESVQLTVEVAPMETEQGWEKEKGVAFDHTQFT